MMRHAAIALMILSCSAATSADEFPKPYSSPCVERENVFEFTERPTVKTVGLDRHEITFAVKGNCDVTVGVVDSTGKIVRHLGSGVLGANAPAPFRKGSVKQTLEWNGKDDLGEYVKEPGKMRVRVSLGLKPEFDRQLGGTSPKNMPGQVIWGLAVDEDGAYVFSAGVRGRLFLRKFDSDAKYVKSLVPPPEDLPEARLAGRGYVEYEPGKKAIHGRNVRDSTGHEGYYLPFSGKTMRGVQPAISKGRIFYCNSGIGANSLFYYVYTDGGSDTPGASGLPLGVIFGVGAGYGTPPALAASPDGQWVYAVYNGENDSRMATFVVWRRSTVAGTEAAKPFIGTLHKPGSDNEHLLSPCGIDCDAQGRIYVCDSHNNRLQIFSPEGKYLKSVQMDRPALVKVHRKTGAIYVSHLARVEGKSHERISRLGSFDNPAVESFLDHPSVMFALDSWSAKPRLWLAGGLKPDHDPRSIDSQRGVTVWEEEGKQYRKISDFEEEAKKEAAQSWAGRWPGASKQLLVCDPTRDQVYYLNSRVFDLKTGASVGRVSLVADDVAFDKNGYVHLHFNPGFYMPGVGRLDVSRPGRGPGGSSFLECPYDYGIEKQEWKGVLPVKDQPGPNYFQNGIGVNMRGDVVVQTQIWHAPKYDDEVEKIAKAGDAQFRSIMGGDGCGVGYEASLRDLKEKEKRGEEIYAIRRQPGVPLVVSTVWTYDRSGQLRDECAAIMGQLSVSPQIDEDGRLYFVNNRPKMVDGKPFLAGKAGIFGEAGDPKTAPTHQLGSLLKTRASGVKALLPNAPVRMDEIPARPPELYGHDYGIGDGRCWVEGAEWIYAGASPIVSTMSCNCPTMRHSTDWYKRSFVPEVYRHSIGIVDAAGNLILHHGRYGNFDSKPGVGMVEPRCVSTTDSYLVYEDWGERLVVLKLNYEAADTVVIGK